MLPKAVGNSPSVPRTSGWTVSPRYTGSDNDATPTEKPDRARPEGGKKAKPSLSTDQLFDCLDNLPTSTIATWVAQAISSHEMMNGVAVARMVFFLPRYSISGPPRMPPTRPAKGIIPPTHEPCVGRKQRTFSKRFLDKQCGGFNRKPVRIEYP